MSNFFEISETTIKPHMGYGWIMAEQMEDLAREGYDVTSLGTEFLYVIDGDDGRVFVPVDRPGVIARDGYVNGWRHEGDMLYWDLDDQKWVEWDELPRKQQKRRLPRRRKRWLPKGIPVEEPRRSRE